MNGTENIIHELQERCANGLPEEQALEVSILMETELRPLVKALKVAAPREAISLLLRFVQEMPDNHIDREGNGILDVLLDELRTLYREILPLLPKEERLKIPKKIR